MDNSCKQLNKIILCHAQKFETIQTVHPLKDPKWPKYLPIKLPEIKHTTRLEKEMIVERGEKNTFGDQTHDIFNDLPKTTKSN